MPEHNLMAASEAYFAERRKLGFKDRESSSRIHAFARYAVMKGHVGPMTAALCLEWARQDAFHNQPFTWAGRLEDLRPFAKYLTLLEPQTEFPDGLPFGTTTRRITPHIYTDTEVQTILIETSMLRPLGGLRQATIRTVIGLVAATGIRISEALGLQISDFDQTGSTLRVQGAKSRRERRLPLHPTVHRALTEHLSIRLRHSTTEPTAPLFISTWSGGPLPYATVLWAFRRIVTKIGIIPRGGHAHPRIHDLRHTFICRRLIAWQEEGVPIDNAMLALSTYVGHASVADTYWYIEGIPDLMALAGARFEAAVDPEGGSNG